MPKQSNYVIDELLMKPSAVCPTLFVGLGGCGCRMVSRIAEHVRRRFDYKERFSDLVKFALVDTNINDLESYREIADGTFLISDFEKEEYADLASGKMFLEPDPYFTQWVPQNYRFRAGDTAGAGQIRIEARLGVFYQMKHKDFVPKFRKLLEDLKSHEHGHRRLDSPEIRIVMCFSVAGGTGSGCHLPIALMLRDQARELGKPWIIGVAVLPAVFEDKTGINKDGTFANGYAALKEMEHLMKLGAPESRFYPMDGVDFHYDPSDGSKRKVRQRPFEFVYVVDKPQSFTVSDPVEAAADGLYLQFFSPLYSYQASDYDNYTQHQRFLVPHDFEGKGIVGFSTFYGSYGAAVLLVPVDGLVEYCAQSAALSLIRSSFLRSIPGDPIYTVLRSDGRFDEVTQGNEKNEKPVHASEFHKKETHQREVLVDRLFMKRVRLLASCEHTEGEAKRFLILFRHGHRPGEIPKSDGSFEHRPDSIKEAQTLLANNGMRYSIAGVVLPAVEGSGPGEPPGLLRQARQTIEIHAQENHPAISGTVTVRDLVNRATTWMDEFRGVGMRVLNNGYAAAGIRHPGIDSLVELRFLNDEAGEVDLAAKRYAVLCIRERVRWDTPPPQRTTEFDLGGRSETDRLKDRDAQALADSLEQQAIDRAMEGIARVFIERLGDFKRSLDGFASTQRKFEDGFDNLEREESRRIERLREEGDRSANEYVLDAEALQIENGRRMWDFYYQDKIADLPEFGLGNRRIQQLLSETVTTMSLRQGGSTIARLEKLYDALRQHIRAILKTYIGGDLRASDRERREGLTLGDALELEVIYRALYRSNTPYVERDKDKAIRDLMTGYRHLPPERQEKLDDPDHRDYLRDKIKRLVKEKASLLCVYEDARDQHGGVRPDHIFAAVIDEELRGSVFADIIDGVDSRLAWVTSDWHNPKEIIFYRSVLNVPLYVFGRMHEMKEHYEKFRRQSRRPRTLHIDQNWENTLPDLDPDSSQERHRQDILRDHVINFAALLSCRHAEAGTNCIIRSEGFYRLVDPPGTLREGVETHIDSSRVLGESLAESIQHLPQVLESDKVMYTPYQQLLRGVREGIAPEILKRVVHLPFQWRQSRDQLRDQYGSSPAVGQQERVKDYYDSYRRLQEALEKLLERLLNRAVEQQTLGEDPTFRSAWPGTGAENGRRNVAQSLEILKTFSDSWKVMENPEQASGIPATFQDLFAPLKESELATTLESLRKFRNRGQD